MSRSFISIILVLSVSGSICQHVPETMAQTISLSGRYSWELLIDIDNTNNTGTVTRTEEFQTTLFVSYSRLVRDVQEFAVKTMTSFESGVKLDVVSVSMSAGIETSVASIFERTTNEKREETVERRVATKIEVGPQSHLKLYRLIFNGPGISYKTETLSSNPSPQSDVIITCNVRPIPFLKDIRVVYTRDAVSKPSNSLEEVDGWNSDINAGFAGEYVWLVPIWTHKISEAVTSIEVIIQGAENTNYADMAKGARGDYRYLKMIRDSNARTGITRVKLWRTSLSDSKPSKGEWPRWTGDINAGRKGDYLYICWENSSF